MRRAMLLLAGMLLLVLGCNRSPTSPRPQPDPGPKPIPPTSGMVVPVTGGAHASCCPAGSQPKGPGARVVVAVDDRRM